MQLDDRYGSPMLDELETFSRQFYTQLEAALGEEAAGVLTVEISSPVSRPTLRSKSMWCCSAQPPADALSCFSPSGVAHRSKVVDVTAKPLCGKASVMTRVLGTALRAGS